MGVSLRPNSTTNVHMRIVLLILSLSISINLFAQDKAAKKILDKVLKTYDTYSNIQVHLDMEVTLAEQSPNTSKVVITQEGDRFVMEHPEQSMYCNGDDLWLYLPDHNEVQINDYEKDAEAGMISPLDILEQYKNGKYNYQLLENRKQRAQIEFQPITTESDYSKYKLAINTTTDKIDQVIAYGKDGSRIVLTIQQLLPNQKYDDSFFSFDKKDFPGVRIEDLRLD